MSIKARSLVLVLLVLLLVVSSTAVAKPKIQPEASPYCIKCVTCRCCSGSGCVDIPKCNGGYDCGIPAPSCASGSPLVFCTRVWGPKCYCH